ncbi:hypothetical protein PCASD_22169 [Puccinia coronata f. sp. avenae]|uniref:Uncharacterized protein n=1 Tax=Puccinia coronata f. sp. avenae TaxID=200324 RepID=A0A2N5U2Q4_9BASI|nr:hypothetical protein PCASD_22169 [Puccinia coronata f. sp. avenae]
MALGYLFAGTRYPPAGIWNTRSAPASGFRVRVRVFSSWAKRKRIPNRVPAHGLAGDMNLVMASNTRKSCNPPGSPSNSSSPSIPSQSQTHPPHKQRARKSIVVDDSDEETPATNCSKSQE